MTTPQATLALVRLDLASGWYRVREICRRRGVSSTTVIKVRRAMASAIGGTQP